MSHVCDWENTFQAEGVGSAKALKLQCALCVVERGDGSSVAGAE